MVMPRSRSRSIESRTWARISRGSTVCVSSRMRSASVDFPWSMWAMMLKLRMWAWSAMAHERLGAAPEAAGEEIRDLARFRDLRLERDGRVGRAAGGQAERHRD